MDKTVSKSDLPQFRPYLAPLLMEGVGSPADDKLVEAVLQIARAEAAGGNPRQMPVRPLARKAHGGGLTYVVKRSPTWWPGGPKETHRQLLVVVAKGGRCAICASDAAFRDKVGKKLQEAKLAVGLSRAKMAKAFAGPEAKTLWLNGIHAPTGVRPDAKVLSGQALEFAIDPLDDHSYYLSALRSRPEIDGLDTASGARTGTRRGARPVVGLAPGRSRVWIGRPGEWDSFVDQAVALLDHVDTPRSQAPASFDRLAREVTSGTAIGKVYAISLLPPALLDEDVEQSAEDTALALRIAYETEFDFAPAAKGSFAADVRVSGEEIGTLHVDLKIDGSGAAALESKWSDDEADPELRQAIARTLTGNDGARIYFDNGFTYADGRIFTTAFVDQEFAWEPRDFSRYDVHREKPGAKGDKLIDAILAETDNSLFDFVREELGRTGFLACDDGSMELADFLLFEPAARHVELIHVKAAGGADRKREELPISVSDFEIVAAQAIKNVRHLDLGLLIERLEDGMENDIARATWKDGVRIRDRQPLIDALKTCESWASRGVTILQPRLTVPMIEQCRSQPGSKKGKQFNQLNALMLGTEQIVKKLGAKFTCYAAKGPPKRTK